MSSDSLNLAQNLAYTALQKPPAVAVPNASHPATASQAPPSPAQPQKKKQPFPILPVLAGAVAVVSGALFFFYRRGKNVESVERKAKPLVEELEQVVEDVKKDVVKKKGGGSKSNPKSSPTPAPTPAPTPTPTVGAKNTLDIYSELEAFAKTHNLPLTHTGSADETRHINSANSLYAIARNKLTPALLEKHRPYLLGGTLENRRYDESVLEGCGISFNTYGEGKINGGYSVNQIVYPKNYELEYPSGNRMSYIGQVVKKKKPNNVIQNGRFVSFSQHLLDHGRPIHLSINIHSSKNELSLLQKKLAVISCLTPPDMVALANGLGSDKITAPLLLFYDLIGSQGISAKIDANGFPHEAIEVIERLYTVCTQKENIQALLAYATDAKNDDKFAKVIKDNIAGLLRIDKVYGLLEPLAELPYNKPSP